MNWMSFFLGLIAGWIVVPIILGMVRGRKAA